MTLRKQIELDRFNKNINKVWSLSIIEEWVLDSVLNFFLAGENNKIKQIHHLLNDETEDLLKTLDSYNIQRYVERYFGMVNECKKCKNLVDYNDEDLLDECDSRGLNEEENKSKLDIVTSSNLDEMTSLFLSFSLAKQVDIINSLKQI